MLTKFGTPNMHLFRALNWNACGLCNYIRFKDSRYCLQVDKEGKVLKYEGKVMQYYVSKGELNAYIKNPWRPDDKLAG